MQAVELGRCEEDYVEPMELLSLQERIRPGPQTQLG